MLPNPYLHKKKGIRNLFHHSTRAQPDFRNAATLRQRMSAANDAAICKKAKDSSDFDANRILFDESSGGFSLDFSSSSSNDMRFEDDGETKEDADDEEEDYMLHLKNFTSPLAISQTKKGELGCRVWNCALALCDYLVVSSSSSSSSSFSLLNKNVLDVGCGVGLGGFVASSLGAKSVTLADCGKNTLENVSKTLKRYDALVALNEGVTDVKSQSVKTKETKFDSRDGRVRVRMHLWEEDEEIVNASLEKRSKGTVRHWSNASRTEDDSFAAPKMADDETFDVIILSDCLYYSSQEVPLAKMLALRLKKEPSAIIVLFQTRRTTSKLVEERFKICCEMHGLEVSVEDVALEKPKRNKEGGVHETRHTIGYARMIMKWRLL